jgi:hypothetical protein
MIPTAEMEAGMLAYEQVQAFASLRRKKLAVIYVLFPLVLVVMAVAAFADAMPIAALVCLASAIFSALFTIWNWRRLRALDLRNRALLARLQSQYGDELPWLQVERQLAEIEKIRIEVARGELSPPDEVR